MKNLFLKKAHSHRYVTDEKRNLSLFYALSEGWRPKSRPDAFSLGYLAKLNARAQFTSGHDVSTFWSATNS